MLDLRHAARRLARTPGFTAVAVLTLGLGIGGATAIFSVADAVILRPLPYAAADRLVLLWQNDRQKGQPFVEMSYPAFHDWREQNRVFADLAGLPNTNQGWVLTGRGEPSAVRGRWVTASFFSVLGVPAAHGRSLLESDDRLGAARVVVLSHGFWRDRFGADPRLVGQSITLDGQPFTVVGVMPQGFAYPKDAQLWMPLLPAAGEIAENRGVWWMSGLGRLRPGISLAQARTEMSALAERYNREQYKVEGFAAVLTPLVDAYFGATRPALLALLGAVGLVLVIACANVASLLLVKATERRGEMAVRLALGASPARLARDLFGESLLLSGLGGALGVLFALVATPLVTALAPSDVPRLQEVLVNGRALAFALLASGLTAVLASMAPALLVRRSSLERTLREASRGVAPGRSRLRAGLVVSEVALALVLLVGAGLLARTFVALRQVPLGFEPAGVLSVDVALPEARYPEARQWRALYQDLLARVSALPGVEAAAVVTLRPLWGTVGMDWPFTVEGQSPADAERNPLLNFEAVSADYFLAMGIALRRGRAFTSADTEGQPGVVVVSESLAKRSWPGENPLGKRLKIPLPGTPYHDTWLSVVGVVADARYRELQASRHDLYMSYLQSNHRLNHLVVRTRAEPSALVAAVRNVVHALDKDQPPPEAVTMTHIVAEALGGPRFAARVFGGFAVVAALLAALGLYGLLACSVSQRTREIGVRVALGARPADVRRLVMGEALTLTATGLGLGLVVALAAARLLESLLFGVRPLDPATFASVVVLLSAVGAAAGLLPARRATRVDPVVALRAE